MEPGVLGNSDFEYTEEDEPDENIIVGLQAEYYKAKGLRKHNVREAIETFAHVVELENEKGEWGFNSLIQLVKLHFRIQNDELVLKYYKDLLSYTKSPVPSNYVDRSINSLIEYLSPLNKSTLFQIYEVTLAALKDSKNEASPFLQNKDKLPFLDNSWLWFKLHLKLGKVCFDRGEYSRLLKVLRDLYNACKREDGGVNLKKGTQLLEIYALEMQLHVAMKNMKKLKEVYQKTVVLKSAIVHPLIVGTIKECAGKMHLSEQEWDEASSDFLAAFVHFNEAGSPRRILCLKYIFIVDMFALSKGSPLEKPAVQPFKNDPEVAVMANLLNSYLDHDLLTFDKILSDNKAILLNGDTNSHMKALQKNIRSHCLLQFLKPYSRVHISRISEELRIPDDEVEGLLLLLIVEKKITARIDQVDQLLLLQK